MAKKVCVIIASDSDKDLGAKVIEVLGKFSVPYQYEQASAHREPKRVEQIVQSTDAEVFICVAGLAGALPGFVAALTNKPVIGVPKSVKLMGLDALLSMAQMPPGVPVATVGIDNGKNAAYLAIRILGIKYPEVLTGENSAIGTTYSSSTAEQPQAASYKPQAHSSSALSNFEFTPPTTSSSQSSFGAFPLFAPETSTPNPQSPIPSPSPAQTTSTPQASSLKLQASRVYGDWGLQKGKPKERPKGDWLQY